MFKAVVSKRIYKTKTRKRNIDWFFQIELPRESSEKRKRIFKSGFATKEAAESAANVQLEKLRQNLDVVPEGLTVARFLDRWLQQHVAKNLARKTAARYQELVHRYVVPRIGEIELQKLGPLQLEQLYGTLRESGSLRNRDGHPVRGLAWKTVRHIHGTLHAAFEAAVRWKLVGSNPAARVDLPKAPKNKAKGPDVGETEFILESLRGLPLHIPALIAAWTGARRGEVLALRWADVDFENRQVRVERSLEQVGRDLKFKDTKTGEGRRFPASLVLLKTLEEHRARQAVNRRLFGDEYQAHLDLIVCQPDGSPLYPDSFTAAYCAHVRKIGKPGVSFHKLRHAHASTLLSRGVSVTAVSKRLGHSTVTTTLNIYAHAFGKDEQHAADVIDEVFEPRLKAAENRPKQ